MTMELNGDLSDFALTDILQILALSRKTGTVLIENGSLAGKITMEDGRITHASLWPGESFLDGLAKREVLSAEMFEKFKEIGMQGHGIWTVESLIVESGMMTRGALQAEARRHVQRIVGRLVGLEKGRFGIAVNQASGPKLLDDVTLSDGLEVGEVLLGSAKERDETLRGGVRHEDRPDDSDALSLYEGAAELGTDNETRSSDEQAITRAPNGHVDRSQLLCSLLTELRFHSYEAEVSLAIMRYASEVATRGILFVVRDLELCGRGQFGLGSNALDGTADRVVRALRIPLDIDSLFSRVVRSGSPFIGPIPRDYWNRELLSKVGGISDDLWLFALPLVCNDRTAYVVYGDNYPGRSNDFNGISELEALVSQASLVLEKISLERRLMDAESKASTRG